MITPLRHLIAAACLLVGTFAWAVEEKSAGSAEQSVQIAESWLKLIDTENYAQSWKEASSRFRASVTEEKWAAMMGQARQPLGAVKSRDSAGATLALEAPRLPKGQYWIVRFKTAFEAAKADEIITLIADTDGQWRVVTFFIRPPT
ncbi:MAG: DUF4019 domain-containing protein [Opitutae bacterium]|nr:DUF4019 domain-containing protein [Opitutae bacterium]